jgi:hypothetical protein
MSALPPIATKLVRRNEVTLCAKSDRTQCNKKSLLNHLVGATRERKRHRDPKRVGGLEVQEQLDFRGSLYRQLTWLFAFENTGDIDAGETVSVRDA